MFRVKAFEICRTISPAGLLLSRKIILFNMPNPITHPCDKSTVYKTSANCHLFINRSHRFILSTFHFFCTEKTAYTSNFSMKQSNNNNNEKCDYNGCYRNSYIRSTWPDALFIEQSDSVPTVNVDGVNIQRNKFVRVTSVFNEFFDTISDSATKTHKKINPVNKIAMTLSRKIRIFKYIWIPGDSLSFLASRFLLN